MTHHRIVLEDAEANDYGVLYRSALVFRASASPGHPIRVNVWSNINRPYREDRAAWPGPKGKYLDPENKGTDDPVSYLLDPQSVMISNALGGRPQYGSEPLRDGDTATLVFPYLPGNTHQEQNVTLHFPKHSNGHGYATAI